jgi:hypothetical protein
VTLVRADGSRTLLGETDGLGQLEIEWSHHSVNGSLLLFCKEGYNCGALELSQERFDVQEEHPIALAPVVFL